MTIRKIFIFTFIFLLFFIYGCSDKLKEYTVSFIGNNNENIQTLVVKEDEKINYPEAPVIEGYQFIGWDQNIEYATSDTNIKALYEILTYNVTFYDNNHNILNTQTVEYNSSAIAPDIDTIAGYKFIGWDKEFNNVKSDLIINAIFEKLSYVVKFYDFNNNLIIEKEVNHGDSVDAPNVPSIDGYKFIGWDQDFSNVTSNLIVKALYQKDQYIVKFYDAEDNVISTQTVSHGASANEVTKPQKTGHTFEKWDTDFSNVTSNLDIKPIFKINKYTVNFYDDNNKIFNTQEVEYGASAVEPNIPEKTGYTFVRWTIEFDFITDNLNIYPIYEENSNVDDSTTYTVTFLDNKGNVLSTSTVKKGEAANAPTAPTINFYNFVKWDTDFSNVLSNLTVKPIYEKTHTTYAISNVNYWLQILTDKYDLSKELLSRSEINAYNQKILSDYNKTKVLDVTKIASTTSGNSVKELINKYSNINKYTIYDDSTKAAITSTEKNNILNNRALNNIPTTVNVKYGIVVDFAWLRSYPTNHFSNNYYMDRFQETSLNVGEAVAIYHTSSDGNWYFVQAQNYNGWIEKKFIAECSYNEMTNFLNPTNRLVVISNYETIEGSHVRMGQSFPLLSQESNYQISFPTRSSSGKLVLKTVTLTNKDSYSVGYLPYTYENIMKQAFKLLGINYSWGDKEQNGRDCSSTMNAIYACFGFMMPRNTSNQVSIPTYGTRINGITSTIMKTYKPGTLIFTSSHVMMYIGENENGVSYLLHNTNSGNGECILQSLDNYGGSKIIGTLKLQ